MAESIKSLFKPTKPRKYKGDIEKARQEGIEFTGDQQVSHGWVDYTVGKTFVQTGHEEVTVMCPSYFEGHRSHPVFEEVK